MTAIYGSRAEVLPGGAGPGVPPDRWSAAIKAGAMAGEHLAANDGENAPVQGAGGAVSANAAELRNVTVLISDLVRSTRTVLNFEPDDARAYLDRAIQSMLACVRKFGGSIASIQGDGVLAIFGTPTATEDHALRACLAATEIRDAFLALPPFA